jgi:hypothetical protein
MGRAVILGLFFGGWVCAAVATAAWAADAPAFRVKNASDRTLTCQVGVNNLITHKYRLAPGGELVLAYPDDPWISLICPEYPGFGLNHLRQGPQYAFVRVDGRLRFREVGEK